MTLRTILSLIACTAIAGSASATVSVFDYTDNFNASVGPATMTEFGPSMGSFGYDMINGESTGVYNFSAAAPKTQGLLVTHNAPANGGGTLVNEYTIGYDIKWKNASGYASFFQTDTTNASDADLFRNGGGGIGISSKYAGHMDSDKWYRVMFVFDLADLDADTFTLYKYIDGAQVGTQVLAYGVDKRWALDPAFLLLADEDGETNAGAISSFFFEDRALSADDVARYGGPTAAGFAGKGCAVPEPATLSLLALGILPALRRRKTA